MPVHILVAVWREGVKVLPGGWTILKVAPVFALLYLLKWYFNGATNLSERNMHSKVVMMTVGMAGQLDCTELTEL
jgi:small-conductance mechanosensitive channel